MTPGTDTTSPAQSPVSWRGVYEAENARFEGATPEINGPEGTPSNVAGFYTSGTKNVGGIRAGSDLRIDFDVDVPAAGSYDLSVLASAFNKEQLNEAQGPVNMFVTVNGGAEQEIYAELGYKWVVWNHTDTTVDLQAGENTITIAAKSLDGSKQTVGTAIIDKIDLTAANPGYVPIYEAENAVLHDATAAYDRAGVSGSGYVPVAAGQSATFWVYSKDDAEKSLEVKTLGGGTATLRVNGVDLASVSDTATVPAFLVGGINKVEVVGRSGTLAVDRVAVGASENVLAAQTIEAESGTLAGTATTQNLSLASGGTAVVGVGGAPGNGNTLTNTVTVAEAGTYAMTVRYSNEEQSPASHYNPDPVARRADVSVNGGAVQKVLFPQSYNANQFWELTVEVELQAGENTIRSLPRSRPTSRRHLHLAAVPDSRAPVAVGAEPRSPHLHRAAPRRSTVGDGRDHDERRERGAGIRGHRHGHRLRRRREGRARPALRRDLAGRDGDGCRGHLLHDGDRSGGRSGGRARGGRDGRGLPALGIHFAHGDRGRGARRRGRRRDGRKRRHRGNARWDDRRGRFGRRVDHRLARGDGRRLRRTRRAARGGRCRRRGSRADRSASRSRDVVARRRWREAPRSADFGASCRPSRRLRRARARVPVPS